MSVHAKPLGAQRKEKILEVALLRAWWPGVRNYNFISTCPGFGIWSISTWAIILSITGCGITTAQAQIWPGAYRDSAFVNEHFTNDDLYREFKHGFDDLQSQLQAVIKPLEEYPESKKLESFKWAKTLCW